MGEEGKKEAENIFEVILTTKMFSFDKNYHAQMEETQ